MKLSSILLVFGFLQVSAAGLSQGNKLNLSMDSVSFEEFVAAVEQQTNYRFVYLNKTIEDILITAKGKNTSTPKLIASSLAEAGLNYEITESKLVIITPENAISRLQPRTITGTVTDETGNPLPGVNIVIKGTITGTTTNLDGNYSIQVDDPEAVLVFTFIGMLTQEIKVGDQTEINLTMARDFIGLEEVVTIGYGKQKRQSITSSVGFVDGKELSNLSSANVSNMIIGRISGITSIQDQGVPGNDESRIYIRGLATTGNNNPLYVIDGILREAIDFQRLATTEIDNISVLKDAAAAAVYGVRGANGIILITTKRGSSQRASFSYSVNYGLQQATRLPDYLDSYEFADLFNKALVNEGRDPFFTDEDLTKFKDGSDPIFHPNTDWMSVLRGVAPMQQHNLSTTGGNEKVKYYLSLNYLNQKSILDNKMKSNKFDFTRYNFRSNIDIQATKTTKVALDVSGYMGKRVEPGPNYLGLENGYNFIDLYRHAPIYSGKYPNGLWGEGFSNRNAWATIYESGYTHIENNGLFTRLELLQDITFIKGLSVKGLIAFDYKPNKSKSWGLPIKIYSAVQDGNDIRYDQVGGFGLPSINESMGFGKNLVLEAHAMYNRSFNKHNVSGLVLFSQQQVDYENISASRINFLSDQLDIIDAGGKVSMENAGSVNQYRRQSLVSRLTYNYDLRYLLEFNFRYDGSDLFIQGKRFGFFPAVSAGWVVSKEEFMKNLSFVDFFKIRGSHGTLGNDQIGQYQYLTFYKFGDGVPLGTGSNFQDNLYLSRLQNIDVTWEKSKKTNVGFEALLLKDFTLEADLFWEIRDDILGIRSATIPDYLGIGSSQLPYENFQKVNNKGIEMVMGYRKNFMNGISIQTRFNFTHASNTVIDIGEPDDKPARIRQEGRPLNPLFGYNALGLFQTEQEITEAYGDNHPNLKPGDIHFEDLNGDKKINGDDITYTGAYNLPINIFGFNLNISFKDIEFSMFWQAGTGNQQYHGNWMAIPFEQDGSALKACLDYWRPDNTDAKYPRITTTSAWNYGNRSSFWVIDTKYLRLKNIEIGYSLPKSITDRVHIQNLRIFFNAVNLLTFSPYKEVDPENTNYYGSIYPQQVIYNFGAEILF